MKLHTLALGEFRKGLPLDDRLEVLGLLVIGERRFIRKDFVEEKFARLGRVLMNLKLPYAGLLLSLRKEAAKQIRNDGLLTWMSFPERSYHETLARNIGHCLSPVLRRYSG
ncbi:hypothetical protein RCO31_12935 [Bradyrhizobium sp. LHD-71]|nr:hypothetical protein [Bradyrhizobium sp. LHD-71]MDQ8728622.1 hypothetical protein [Bradyrhizobium sp. LHD-71]